VADVVQLAVDELAATLGHSVLIEDPYHRPLWWSAHDDVDGTRERTILRRPLGPAAVELVARLGLARATGPVHTPAVPEAEMLPRWCVPIRSPDQERVLLGYVWVVDSDPGLGEDQLPQLTACAALAAEVLARRALADRSRDARRRDLLHRLAAAPDPAALTELLSLERLDAATRVVVTAPRGEGGWELPDDLGAHLVGLRPRPAASGAPVALAELHVAVARATATRRALAAGARLAHPSWDSLGAWRLVVAAPDDLQPGDLHPGADQLAALPRPDLLVTARTVLELGGDVVHAAAELHVHRSTLYYRLDRIADLTGVDLRSGAGRLDLQFALRLAAYRRSGR
jgi:hypothetical protein